MVKVKKTKKRNIEDDSEVVMKMIALLDIGYSWKDIATEMCKTGQLEAFIRNYEMVRFICEADALEKGVK